MMAVPPRTPIQYQIAGFFLPEYSSIKVKQYSNKSRRTNKKKVNIPDFEYLLAHLLQPAVLQYLNDQRDKPHVAHFVHSSVLRQQYFKDYPDRRRAWLV